MFERFDPSSTGPNVLPWAEWTYFVRYGDRERLALVFPALLAYTQWFRTYRTWLDGSYWTSGWGCGMDNLPRMEPGYHEAFSHGRMRWVDTSLQAVMAADILCKMATVLGRGNSIHELRDECTQLKQFVNDHLWDDQSSFYYDQFSNGKLNRVKHIGSYWALLAGVVPPDRIERFIAHLDDPAEFNRPHRIPALAHSHPEYDPNGGYWLRRRVGAYQLHGPQRTARKRLRRAGASHRTQPPGQGGAGLRGYRHRMGKLRP